LIQSPDSGDQISGDQFFNTKSYKQNLAKLYAGSYLWSARTCRTADISGIDEGESQYIRGFWLLQELTTDEAVIAWNDGTIKTFIRKHGLHWIVCNRRFCTLLFQVVNCNEF
jgi:hypothetical protein